MGTNTKTHTWYFYLKHFFFFLNLGIFSSENQFRPRDAYYGLKEVSQYFAHNLKLRLVFENLEVKMCIYDVELGVCVIGNVGGNQSNKGFK